MSPKPQSHFLVCTPLPQICFPLSTLIQSFCLQLQQSITRRPPRVYTIIPATQEAEAGAGTAPPCQPVSRKPTKAELQQSSVLPLKALHYGAGPRPSSAGPLQLRASALALRASIRQVFLSSLGWLP